MNALDEARRIESIRLLNVAERHAVHDDHETTTHRGPVRQGAHLRAAFYVCLCGNVATGDTLGHAQAAHQRHLIDMLAAAAAAKVQRVLTDGIGA